MRSGVVARVDVHVFERTVFLLGTPHNGAGHQLERRFFVESHTRQRLYVGRPHPTPHAFHFAIEFCSPLARKDYGGPSLQAPQGQPEPIAVDARVQRERRAVLFEHLRYSELLHFAHLSSFNN